jgi:nicotinamide mononucleotide transporter
MELFEELITGIVHASLWEWIAVACNIAYVVLIAQQKVAGWYFGLLGSAIYIYINVSVQYYIEAQLQIFYVIMAIIGIYFWKKRKDNKTVLRITEWHLKFHLINISLGLLLTMIWGYLFSEYTEQSNPYTDAFTTVFSLTGTYLTTRKIVSSWLYWIIIDLISVYLYFDKALTLSSLLFFAYSVLAVYGYFKWRKEVLAYD